MAETGLQPLPSSAKQCLLLLPYFTAILKGSAAELIGVGSLDDNRNYSICEQISRLKADFCEY
jgi:hypothetical protein